ncbi:endonuclease III [Anaerovorax odorimutans]|uniref:Endonuclease III n=1 Tax=Anaerovorax odorimutans TaxID=109327 RepID=A0ABT1RJK0_9FIRM|nr:endonuclease III [Anaerovorax odorimutans]MCQ4635353.1 endonuclease III [Anaerovorax odorimutans]
MSFTKSQVNEILDKLELQYPDADCALEHGSVFQLLVAVVLSAQTTDKSVNVVTKKLFETYPDAHALARADQENLEETIKRIGMYKTKSKNILALAKMLVEKYDGQVPEAYDKLIELPGVGRKTANVVLSVGFGHQRIAVDTHVFRVSNRIGLVSEKDVLKTELALMKTLPEDRWSRAHHSLIFHGRYCCHARKPDCENCVIGYICKKKGVNAK